MGVDSFDHHSTMKRFRTTVYVDRKSILRFLLDIMLVPVIIRTKPVIKVQNSA
jgi:hypothetical protein